MARGRTHQLGGWVLRLPPGFELSEVGSNLWTAVPEGCVSEAKQLTLVTAWPAGLKLPNGVRFEEERVQLLADQLALGSGPLLVNQPWELFEGERLYERVLGNPATRRRQVVWATSTAAVPIALDAEKIIVTRELAGGTKLEFRYGGDLHEDEIRKALLTHFEGGEAGFRRKMAIYRL